MGTASPPKWLAVAESFLGTSELVGSAHNPVILSFLAEMRNLGAWGKGRDETAWCAAFVHYCLDKAGREGTGHALARSYIKWGVPSERKLGAIVVLKYKGNRDGGTGSRAGFHVGFLIRESAHSYRVLGGNQADTVSYRNFPKKAFELVACRWPEEAQPTKPQLSQPSQENPQPRLPAVKRTSFWDRLRDFFFRWH
jgi:uncharacterized protein (TIGR02594 family)